MSHRLLALAVSAVVTGAVGVSLAAGAPDYGPSKPKAKRGGPIESMTASRLAWSAYLNGAAVVDADGDDAGDPAAKGTAMFLQVDARTVCYGFALRGAGEPSFVHIHKGVAGKNGPPVVAFVNVPMDTNGAPSGDPGSSSGCKTTQDPKEIKALRRIRRNPSGYYVNIDTLEFPDGAVRGQLSRLRYNNAP
jgi:CHRD domain